jgi:hypothetical protein
MNWRGRISRFDLLIKLAWFCKKVNNVYVIKSSWSKQVSTWRSTVLSLPFQQGFPGIFSQTSLTLMKSFLNLGGRHSLWFFDRNSVKHLKHRQSCDHETLIVWVIRTIVTCLTPMSFNPFYLMQNNKLECLFLVYPWWRSNLNQCARNYLQFFFNQNSIKHLKYQQRSRSQNLDSLDNWNTRSPSYPNVI